MPRPIWSGTLSFGLLNVPVSLMSGERRTDLHFRMLDSRNNAPIRYERVNAETGEEGGGSNGDGRAEDELFDAAVAFVLETRKTSISSLQRHLRIGYNRSANLMDALERAGIVSPAELGGSRKILARAPHD